MNSQEYDAFTKTLIRSLESDSRVLGLMTAGSTARQSHQPDEWSDHDFWVIAQSDAVAWFRTHREWLPNSEHIVLSFIDPIHNGLAAIYDNGHLIEFAVSDREGLRHAKLNDFQLLIDRDKMASDMAQLHRATSAEFDAATWYDEALVGQFLTSLWIGIGRYQRGEHLSARQMITVSSLHALLRLIAKHIPANHTATLDNLDPLRRFEIAYPEIAADINDLLQLSLDRVADRLIDVTENLLRDQLDHYPQEAAEVIRRRIVCVQGVEWERS